MNKHYLIVGLAVIVLSMAIYFYGHNGDVISDLVKIKCPEEYAENDFDLYVADATKWNDEMQAKNPDMTGEELWETRQQALISSGCQGRGEQDTEPEKDDNNTRPITAEELEEYKKDPTAPEWLRNAESCTWVGEKIFCKLKGE